MDLYLPRDLDSRFSDRELAAVNEWFKSGKAFHFMRDHPYHGTTILGSGWGVQLNNTALDVREKWRQSWKKAMGDPIMRADRKSKGPDQQFLNKYVLILFFWIAKKSYII